jgi:ABC-type proline/glycine betaine transport system ATPase subunit
MGRKKRIYRKPSVSIDDVIRLNTSIKILKRGKLVRLEKVEERGRKTQKEFVENQLFHQKMYCTLHLHMYVKNNFPWPHQEEGQ